jgi:hypothetical protein
MFDAVCGFDERLVTDEDTDISRRLVAAGARLVEAPDVRVIHLGNAKTLREFARKEKWHATSILDTMRKHQMDRPMLLTLAFLVTVVLALLAVPLALAGTVSALALLPLPLLAPVATAAYRVTTYGNYRHFFRLVPLYFIVYVVRSIVIGEAVFGRRPRPSQDSSAPPVPGRRAGAGTIS